ncbi:MAG: hypothetical protein U0Q12_11675 [Vicinamibacterales bacterium]
MTTPIDVWHGLLRPDVELSESFWDAQTARLRAAKLTFGSRITCPFLRPCFIDASDAAYVARVGDVMWRLGERVAHQAFDDSSMLAQLRLNDEEAALARIEPGYRTASTASRLDAFLLPDSLKFAEYNAESPAGLGYSQTLGEVFLDLEVTSRFREHFSIVQHPLMERLLDALIASYREWGGTATPPRILITDWREVPTWNEFEIIQARFEALGVPTTVADPRDLAFDGSRLIADGRAIDLVYRRVLMNDIVSRPDDCRALVEAYRHRAVCVANTFRCKLPHKKTFFAVLTDERFAPHFTPDEHEVIRRHVPWTRLVEDVSTTYGGRTIALLDHIRRHRDDFVMKPSDEYGGSGVTLGWDTPEATWESTIQEALAKSDRAWLVQERIPIRREVFPWARTPAETYVDYRVEFKDMLVDFAPYLFRGRLGGYLTRLSSTGLANVTSGGGQVPVFETSPH